MPLNLGYHPPGLLPRTSPVGEGVEKHLRLSGGPSNRSGHEVLYLMIEVVVRLEPDGIQDSFILQVLVDVRCGEGRVSPQVELLAHLPVPINYWGEELTPPVSRVDVAGSQDRPLAVPVVVEAEERMVTGRFK